MNSMQLNLLVTKLMLHLVQILIESTLADVNNSRGKTESFSKMSNIRKPCH